MAKPWQELLDVLTTKLMSELTSDYFSNSEKLMTYICSEHYYRSELLEWLDSRLRDAPRGKSPARAAQLRAEGNRLFQAQRFPDSLRLYWESARHAEPGSEELALAHSNRSAALLHLGQLQDCLRETELALAAGLPRRLHFKLHLRRAECLFRLGRFGRAGDAYSRARECLAASGMQRKHQVAVEEEIVKGLNASWEEEALGRGCDDPVEASPGPELPRPSYGESDVLAHASAALELRYSEEKGRHVVANRDISAGDTLFVERPFALVVLPDEGDAVHCHHCCAATALPVPCERCADGAYCGAACREKAWRAHHRWECAGGLRLLQSLGIAHLALRVLLGAGGAREALGAARELSARPWSPVRGPAACDGYAAVHQLLPHLERLEREDFVQYALTAALLALYLSGRTDYLSDPGEEEGEGALAAVAALLHRHVAQLVCNGHAVTELRTEGEGDVVTERQARVATAIYPSASMLNHSCDPNIINSFYNQYLIIRACRDIPKGEEVVNCYGPHFRRTGTRERRALLSGQYHFACACNRCTSEAYFDFLDRFGGLQCLSCGGPLLEDTLRATPEVPHPVVCIECGDTRGYEQLAEMAFQTQHAYREGRELLEAGAVREALARMLECWRVQSRCLFCYSSAVLACQDDIARCHATLGNYGGERAVPGAGAAGRGEPLRLRQHRDVQRAAEADGCDGVPRAAAARPRDAARPGTRLRAGPGPPGPGQGAHGDALRGVVPRPAGDRSQGAAAPEVHRRSVATTVALS
ncbi:SET and MYND domain-containing protein 4-like [Bacillus rossius redtenbacheri]|uniref:SET and MYND domain-containing protein 4-like n=1 Tax=Bacillus rossius redtenbacheri TaxID=93214 RepID=UPI002FDD073A